MGGLGVAGGELRHHQLATMIEAVVGMSAVERISTLLPAQGRCTRTTTLTITSFNTSYSSSYTWDGFRQTGFLLFCIIIWGVHILFLFLSLTTPFSFLFHF
ncbi:hypothetical protein HOY82DRAFT_513565 [Tuber indicum]|nr:hypothetical protein HOY82DRAFT_513565 [Tuber indicum]